jgi:sigma-B regulation protein RsbQ
MSVKQRNNVRIHGSGPATMMFAHGFGCDQNMWRFLAPHFGERFRTILFDLTGSGGSDLKAYDQGKHGTLHGHAQDVLEIIDECADGPVIFVGHSVSATIGMLAAIRSPESFGPHIMIGPCLPTSTMATTSGASPGPISMDCSIPWKAISSAGRPPWRQSSWARRTSLS